jgi:hypothetical protein
MASMASAPEKTSSPDTSSRSQLMGDLVHNGTKTMRLGVWEAWSPAKPRQPFTGLGTNIHAYFSELGASINYVRRFLADIYKLGPRLIMAVWIVGISESSLSGWTVYFSNKLLGTVSTFLSILFQVWVLY